MEGVLHWGILHSSSIVLGELAETPPPPRPPPLEFQPVTGGGVNALSLEPVPYHHRT